LSEPKAHRASPRTAERGGTSEIQQNPVDDRWFVDAVLETAGSLVCVIDPEGRFLRYLVVGRLLLR